LARVHSRYELLIKIMEIMGVKQPRIG